MNWLWLSLYHAAAMLWETLWALVLGFSLSAGAQVFLRKEQITRQLGRAGLREVARATFFGAVSSSCSYAAAATAKTLFKKGAALVPTLAFMFAATNLVFELGFILWLLLGWEFLLAEVIGAFVLIGVMWLLVQLTLPKGLVETARKHSEAEEKSCCHSHGIDMADADDAAAMSKPGKWTQVATAFIMDTAMMWKEVLIGFFIAGLLMALVPDDWWKTLFITRENSPLHLIENAVVGPLIAVASFVCSIGNIPLAGLLWSGGISFGGVISFIYADLVIIPLILIYRKYYGTKTALYITSILFISMVSSGIIVDLLFGMLKLIPTVRPANPMTQATFQWNYTTWLNLVAILVIGCFIWLHCRKKHSANEAKHGH